jgi:acetaldehyde dehydrogenase
MKKKIPVAVIGPGNIGTDLMMKIRKSKHLHMAMMAGIVESEGIKRARAFGVETTTDGINGLLARKDKLGLKIVFDATSSKAHLVHASLLRKAGLVAIDLTPAAAGPYLVPSVNPGMLEDEWNVNMVTCGGQATVPIVYAVSRVAGAEYAEIVSAISSRSAGPGTRANIDEFTETTASALERVGGAKKGKAIIILNPADPPIQMNNTVYVRISDNSDGVLERIRASVDEIVASIQQYVPGYEMRVPPMLDGDKVTVVIRVRGAGDFLPEYSGNLDIMNAAAVRAAELISERMGDNAHE